MQKSYCYTPGVRVRVRVGVSVSVGVGVHIQNVRGNVKVMKFQSLCIFSCIWTLLIILIKPHTTKAHDRRASGDCGTSGYLLYLVAFTVHITRGVTVTIYMHGWAFIVRDSISMINIAKMQEEIQKDWNSKTFKKHLPLGYHFTCGRGWQRGHWLGRQRYSNSSSALKVRCAYNDTRNNESLTAIKYQLYMYSL